jgi:hypothetical protein
MERGSEVWVGERGGEIGAEGKKPASASFIVTEADRKQCPMDI